MRDLPAGFQLHKGLDGLLGGLFLVFLVKIERAVSRLVDWRLVPEWTYRPIDVATTGLNRDISSLFEGLTGFVSYGGAAGGGSGGSTGALVERAVTTLVTGLVKVVGSPVLLAGVSSAAIVEQALVVLGAWIAVLVPLWYWGIRPTLFWWRDRDAG